MAKTIDSNNALDTAEFYCPYCRDWITDVIHKQHYHNDTDEPDERRDWRLRIDGVIYEDEEHYESILISKPWTTPCSRHWRNQNE